MNYNYNFGYNFGKEHSKWSMLGFREILMEQGLTERQAFITSKLLTYSFMLGFLPLTMKGTISKKFLKNMKESTDNQALKNYIDFIIPVTAVFSINFYALAKMHEKKQKQLKLQEIQNKARKYGINIHSGKREKTYKQLENEIAKKIEKGNY